MISKRKILITGGAGFIGYHLARHLLNEYKNNVSITLVDNFQRGQMDQDLKILMYDSRIMLLNLDLTKISSYKKITGKYDQVYHLAAINGTKNFYNMPHEVLRVNTLSLIYLLTWLKNNNPNAKLCFTSSSEVYAGLSNVFHMLPIPTPENVPLVIEDQYNARWSYAATKLLGEFFVINYAEAYNLKAVIVRPHNFYGPRAGNDHVIPEFISHIIKRTDPFVIYGAKDTRTFCYISDAVRAMQLLMDSSKTNYLPPEIFNIGGTYEITIKELAKKLFEVANWKPQCLDYRDAPIGSVSHRRADITKLISYTDWKPLIYLKKGLTRAYKWYQKNVF